MLVGGHTWQTFTIVYHSQMDGLCQVQQWSLHCCRWYKPVWPCPPKVVHLTRTAGPRPPALSAVRTWELLRLLAAAWVSQRVTLKMVEMVEIGRFEADFDERAHTHTPTHIYIHICLVIIYLFIYLSIHLSVYLLFICLFVSICWYKHTHTHTYIPTYLPTYIHTYIHTYTYCICNI